MIIVADYMVVLVCDDGNIRAVVNDGNPVHINGLVQTQAEVIEWCYNPYQPG